MSLRILGGLHEVADAYDGFILDLWGVVHDGARVFPGVADALDRLDATGKRIAFLSNAPRRAAVVAAGLDRLGIPVRRHAGVMSSGEEAWRCLAERPDDWYRALGRACLHIGPERDHGLRDGLDLEVVETVADADFILNTGTWRDGEAAEAYDGLLREAAARDLPMVCANADRIVVRGGRTEICAGTLADHYEALGGRVRWHGKPDPSVFEACFALLGIADRRRILCVGDSLRTDIKGANNVGIDSALVTGGIHAVDFGGAGGVPDPDRIAAAAALAGVRPSYAAAGFAW